MTLPALTARTYNPPSGCTYQQVSGTETTLVAALACGTRDTLSLVSLSASDPRAALLEMHGSTVRQVRSGKFSALPANPVW